MTDESGFLEAIRADPDDQLTRQVYADWLEERGDPRGDFLRLFDALSATAPDHPEFAAGEDELGELRSACDPAWLALVDRGPHAGRTGFQCTCGLPLAARETPRLCGFHVEVQDTACDAWKRVIDAVEAAADDGREEFVPLSGLNAEEAASIVTLPPSIARLKQVKRLVFYGSHVTRIPPEIGEMTALETFVPYTSYRLHWFPYEITCCRNLRDSTVSTRAVYGNSKYRSPFPPLEPGAPAVAGRVGPARLPLKRRVGSMVRPCSVCGTPFEDRRLHRVWISRWVATDVLPLLVNACSAECVARLPSPPDRFVPTPHRGGPGLQQPVSPYLRS